MGRVRSYNSPLRRATMAASARRVPIDLAISMGRIPASTDRWLPSGRVISMLLIGKFQRNTCVRDLKADDGTEPRALPSGCAACCERPFANARGSVLRVGVGKGLRYDGDGSHARFKPSRSG